MVEVFSPRSTAERLAAEHRRLVGDMLWDDVETYAIPGGGGAWQLWKTPNPARAVATGIWVNGRPASLDFTVRARQAWSSLFGGSSVPVLMVLTADPNPLQADTFDVEQAATRLIGFVRTRQALAALASQLADVRE